MNTLQAKVSATELFVDVIAFAGAFVNCAFFQKSVPSLTPLWKRANKTFLVGVGK